MWKLGGIEHPKKVHPSFGGLTQVGCRPRGACRFLLDERLEWDLCVIGYARIGGGCAGEAIDWRNRRRQIDRHRRAAVTGGKLAELPLPRKEPQRVVDTRLEPWTQVIGAA